MAEEQGTYNKKRLLALGVLVLLVVLLLALIWWWFVPKGPTIEGPIPTASEPAQDTVQLPSQRATSTEIPPRNYPSDAGDTEVRALARSFAERYGSWSTDSNFQNLKDLMPKVTSRLQEQFERTMATTPTPREFKSAETRVVQITIDDLTASSADVTVVAQQVTRDALLQETEQFVELALSMVKEGEFWYVDSAEWATQ